MCCGCILAVGEHYFYNKRGWLPHFAIESEAKITAMLYSALASEYSVVCSVFPT